MKKSISDKLRELSLVNDSTDKLSSNLQTIVDAPVEDVNADIQAPENMTAKVANANNGIVPMADEPMRSIQVYVPMSVWQRMLMLKAKTGRKLKDLETEAFVKYLEGQGV